MFSVAVTGARGIIGRRFCEAARARGLWVEPFDGDVQDAAAVSSWLDEVRPEAVVHCAAIVEVARVDTAPALALSVNVGGTLNVVKSVGDLKHTPWMFYASTSHVYAPSTSPIAETYAVAPRNIYSLTKHLGEQTASFFAAAREVPLCVGRIFSIYDPEQTGSYLVPAMAARIAAQASNVPIKVFDGGSVRDFSRASDVAAAILRLMERRATGIVNIGSGEGRTVVDHLQRLFGSNATFVAEPSRTTTIVADVGRLRHVSM